MLRPSLARLWFKKKLDFQARAGRARLDEGKGWVWLGAHAEANDKMKEAAKKLARKCKYTVGDLYAQQVRAAKKAWFKGNSGKE